MDALPQRLAGGTGHDAEAGQQKADADAPQGVDSDFQHGPGGVKQRFEEPLRRQLKHKKAGHHKARGIDRRPTHRAVNALHLSRAVVVADDGNHAVVQSEYRHEEEALDLEIGPVDSYCGGTDGLKGAEDQVHHIVGEGADDHHQDGGETDLVDLADNPPARPDLPDTDGQLPVFRGMEDQTDDRRDSLADHCGRGRAGGGQTEAEGHRHRKAAELDHIPRFEDEKGVEDDVCHRAHHLGPHRQMGPSRGLQQAFHRHLHIQEKGNDGDDTEVGIGIMPDALDLGLGVDENPRSQQSEQRHQQPAADREEDPGSRHPNGLIPVVPSQSTGDQRADPNAGTGADADHDILRREGQRQRSEAFLRHPRDIDAVHHIVERLDQHGEHHWDRKGQQQPPLGHLAHAGGILSVVQLRHNVLLWNQILFLLYQEVIRIATTSLWGLAYFPVSGYNKEKTGKEPT